MQEEKDTTILIPTHNRHKYLARVLSYYGDKYSIFVADSSLDPFSDYYGDNVTYEYYGGFGFFEKMCLAISKVNTKYVVMCADDDFIVPSAIRKCTEFLDKNIEYVACEGNSIIFKNILGLLVSLPYVVEPVGSPKRETLGYVDFFGKTVYSDFPRTNNHFYSVFKTEILKEYFELAYTLSKEIKSVRILEFLLVIVTAARGHKKFIDVFYTAKEGLATSESVTATDIEAISLREWEILKGFLKKYFISLGYAELQSCQLSETMVQQLRGIKNEMLDRAVSGNLMSLLGAKVYQYLQALRFVASSFFYSLKTFNRPGFPYFDVFSAKEWRTIKTFLGRELK